VSSSAMSATALWALIAFLREIKYHFITPTPATHERVNSRSGNEWARSVMDVFGWSRPFAQQLLPERLFDTLKHFPFSVNRSDTQRAANKILWSSQAEEAGNGVFERFTSSSDPGC
jgi:hypothetical protein